MKKALTLALTIIMVSAPVSAAPTTDGECKDLYPRTGIVTDVEHLEDCWSINDLASCIMESNGTEIVYDDEIVDAHYAGGLKQFARYARED